VWLDTSSLDEAQAAVAKLESVVVQGLGASIVPDPDHGELRAPSSNRWTSTREQRSQRTDWDLGSAARTSSGGV
jgi:hypothetical protein